MSLESENRVVTPLEVPLPTRTFAMNPLSYQASSAGEAVPWTAPRGRRDAWVDLGCWRWDQDTVVNSSVCTPPLSDSRTADFCVPTAERTPTRVDAYRWLLGVATPLSRPEHPRHRYHALAQPRASLLCSPRTYPASPCRLHAFAKINKDVNHFCLCRSDTACASKASCSDAMPPRAIDRVRWYHLVSYPRAALGHCDQLSHTRYTFDSMHIDRVAVLGPY